MTGSPAFCASGDWATASWLETEPKVAATPLSAIAAVISLAAVAASPLVSFQLASIFLPDPRNS